MVAFPPLLSLSLSLSSPSTLCSVSRCAVGCCRPCRGDQLPCYTVLYWWKRQMKCQGHHSDKQSRCFTLTNGPAGLGQPPHHAATTTSTQSAETCSCCSKSSVPFTTHYHGQHTKHPTGSFPFTRCSLCHLLFWCFIWLLLVIGYFEHATCVFRSQWDYCQRLTLVFKSMPMYCEPKKLCSQMKAGKWQCFTNSNVTVLQTDFFIYNYFVKPPWIYILLPECLWTVASLEWCEKSDSIRLFSHLLLKVSVLSVLTENLTWRGWVFKHDLWHH